MKKVIAFVCVLAVMLMSFPIGTWFAVAEGEETFTAWNERTWSKADQAVYHLALDGPQSDDDDSNWHNFRRAAQEFVPGFEQLTGCKVALNLTSGNAKMHVEIRETVNGSAIYTEEMAFSSKGNARHEYAFTFSETVNVTPGKVYYLAYWLTERNQGSVCILYGSTGVSPNPHPGYEWKIGTPNAHTEFVKNSSTVWSFEVLSNEKDVSFRTLDDWSGDVATEYGMAKAISTNYTEGTGSMAFTISETQQTNSNLFFYLYSVGRNPVDASGATAMIFDLYCPDEAFGAALSSFTGDGGVNLDSASVSGSWNNSAGKISRNKGFASALKNLTVGWNHIVMPLDAAMTVTDLLKFRFYITGITLTAGTTFLVDDVRFVNDAYLDGQTYADTKAAKMVIASISQLSADSDADAVKTVKAQYDALTGAQKALVTNVSVLEGLMENLALPVCISFRSMDSSSRTAQEAATSTADSSNCLEGSGSVLFEHAVDRTNGLYWYVYCEEDVASSGVDITGMTYILFDLYVSDPEAWTIGSGDARLGIRSVGSSGWTGDCAEVTGDELRTALSALQQGWNHLALPLRSLGKTDAFAFRMYVVSGTAQQGFYTLMDDVRLCNKSYLNSQEYADSLVAKKVAAKIGVLDETSDSDALTAAREEYNRLTENQQALVSNLERLEKLEKGESLTTPQTFQAVPDSHLTDRTGTPGEFSIAAINDLHYACNYNGQQQEVYYNAMRWIVDNAQTENIQMAVQLGDATSSNRLYQWQIARQGWDILKDGGVPYTAVVGNHDLTGIRNAASFNAFFPAEQETKVNPYYAGAKVDGQMENVYYTFTVNEVDYMLLTLECYPSDDALAWADEVIKAHPNHNVILVTHSYLQMRNGAVDYTQETEALAQGFKGKTVWEKVVKGNPNVFMTLSAHNSNKGNVALMTETNDAGKPVYQFLVPDPQDYEAQYGGMGFVYLIRFSNYGRTVSCELVSTRYDKDFGTVSNVTIAPQLIYNENLTDLLAAQLVENQIAALGEITLESEAAIAEARSAYDSLTDDQKALVTNLDKLTAAEGIIAVKKADKAAADEVIVLIDALPAADTVTLESETAIAEARSAYDSLTDDQKALVTNLDKLTAAEGIIAVKKADKAAADEVIVLIDALPESITLADKEQVVAARAAYDALTEGQKALVSAETLEKLTQAEEAVSITLGDINEDGDINASDALLALQHSVKLITLEDNKFEAADVNKDDVVDASDALKILQHSVGLIEEF